MKTAYDRGYEKGLESLSYEGCTPPAHYKEQERTQWVKGWIEAYIHTYGTDPGEEN